MKRTILIALLGFGASANALQPTNIDLYCQYTRQTSKDSRSPWKVDPSLNVRIESDGSTVITSPSRWMGCKEWRGTSNPHTILGICRNDRSLSKDNEEQIEISRIDGKLRHTFVSIGKPGNESYEFLGHGTCRKADTIF